jgi:hypothetical protein
MYSVYQTFLFVILKTYSLHKSIWYLGRSQRPRNTTACIRTDFQVRDRSVPACIQWRSLASFRLMDDLIHRVAGAIQSTLETKRHSTTSRGILRKRLLDPSQVALDVLIYMATAH